MPEERTGQLAMGRQTRSRASDEDDLVGERQRLVGWGRHKTRRVHARACVDCVFRQAGRQATQARDWRFQRLWIFDRLRFGTYMNEKHSFEFFFD